MTGSGADGGGPAGGTAAGRLAAGPAPVEVLESPVAAAERSPADILRLGVAATCLLAVLVLQWLGGDAVVDNARDLLRGLDTLPTWLITLVVAATWLAGLVTFIGGALAALARQRGRAVGAAVLGGALALALAALLGVGDEPSAPAVADHGTLLDTFVDHPTATALTVAVTAGIATAAAPWVGRGWRRLAWAVVLGVMLGRFLVTPVDMASVRSLLAGWTGGALAVVVLGAPPRRAGGRAIAGGLAAVGVPVRRIEQASLDARGSTPYFAEAPDGRTLFVKALGRDERSADLLFRVYRRIVPRDLGDERGYLSLRRAVEHEALVALAARDLGVRTPRFVALATAEPASFVLAYEGIEGRSLDRVDPHEVTDDLLAAVWDQVATLRSHRVAHRDLRLANVFVAADGAVWMIDFGFSELAATDTLLATDVAELLAATTLQVGIDRAVAAAVGALGPEAVATAADRLQPWALSGATRTAFKERPGLLDELRERLAAGGGAGG
jgi:glycosyltransferase 2 family protein